jgi:hypothetical protein
MVRAAAASLRPSALAVWKASNASGKHEAESNGISAAEDAELPSIHTVRPLSRIAFGTPVQEEQQASATVTPPRTIPRL